VIFFLFYFKTIKYVTAKLIITMFLIYRVSTKAFYIFKMIQKTNSA